MTPNQYTELFFLDEATGLAAGHRPCGECQRARYRAFVEAWARGNPGLAGGVPPKAPAIDAVLDRERLDEHREKRVHLADLAALPDGAMVTLDRDDRAYLILAGSLYPWSFEGYGSPVPKTERGEAWLLTPPSIVNALAAGYVAAVHPTARASQQDTG
jgi:hypothetical protein